MRRGWICALVLAGCGGGHVAAGDDGIASAAGGSSDALDDGEDEVADTIGDWWDGPAPAECPMEPSASVREVVRADAAPPSVSGGTLVLAEDGVLAFAADPDRDAIHVVDVVARKRIGSIALHPGSEPGRLVEDARGHVHVVLRGAGAIAEIDPRALQVVATTSVCANPRGLAIDARSGAVVVACAEGLVARIDPDGGVSSIDVGIELRDVVEVGPPLLVSAYRTAEVLAIDEHGAIVARERASTAGLPTPEALETDYTLNTARRTIATGDGGWAMLHQAGFHDRIESRPHGWGSGECLPVQASVVTWHGAREGSPVSLPSSRIAPAFDFAISRDARWLAVVGSGAEGWAIDIGSTDPSLVNWDASCTSWGPPSGAMVPVDDLPGAPTAVAFDADGLAWVQLREPASLFAIDPVTLEREAEIALSDITVADSGHDLFHRATTSRIACASCHPEGREDGVAWRVDDELRRSQALSIGIAGSEPFHWHGEMADLTQIADEIHGERMCGERLSAAHTDALARYVFGLRPLKPRPSDADAIARGAEVFARVGCATCHGGARYTNDLTMLVRNEMLQVPSLLAVSFRVPLMHDGRSPTLRDAVLDMLALGTAEATDAEVDDLVAYVASL